MNINKEEINLKEINVPITFKVDSLELMPLKNLFKLRALQKAFMIDCKNSGLLKIKPNIKFISLSQSKGFPKEEDLIELQDAPKGEGRGKQKNK